MAAIIVLDVFIGIIAVAALIATGNQLRARLDRPGAADWRLSAAGHWRRRRTTTTPPRTLPGMGPLELGRPPGRGRLARNAAETAADAEE